MLVFTRKEGRTHAAQVETEAVSTVLCVLPLPCYVIKRATWFFRPSTFGHCCAFFFLVAESPNAHFFFSVIDCRSRGVALSAAEGAVGIPDSVFFFYFLFLFPVKTHTSVFFFVATATIVTLLFSSMLVFLYQNPRLQQLQRKNHNRLFLMTTLKYHVLSGSMGLEEEVADFAAFPFA